MDDFKAWEVDGRTELTLPLTFKHTRLFGLSRDGGKLYVSAETNNTVSVIDTKTGEVLHTLHVGENPRTVAFTHEDYRTVFRAWRALYNLAGVA